jgi:hypothetical protein
MERHSSTFKREYNPNFQNVICLWMDKASPPLYKSKKVVAYFEENKDTLIPAYLPTTASPELW